jgi:GH43 family beta-xylosidase
MRTLSLCLMLALFTSSAFAQDYGAIEEAFSLGNASALVKQMDGKLEFTLNGKASELSRNEAEGKVRAFFLDHEPKAFEWVHKGVSKGDVHYCIGQLTTSSGPYRVTIYLHKQEESYEIQSIEIEQD